MTPLTRRLAVFLALSVALNLLFIGAMVGRRLHHGRLHASPEEALERHGPRPGGLRKVFEGRRGDAAGRREATRGARLAVKDVLVREPFEATKVEAALAALRVENGKNQELFHRVLVEAAASGTPEGRRELSSWFEGERGRRFRQ